MLQLHEGLDEHTIGVEHLCATVSMPLYFSVIVESSSALAQKWENFRIGIEVWLHIFKAIESLFILLLLLLVWLLITLILKLRWLIELLLLLRLVLYGLLHHPIIIFLISKLNIHLLSLLLFLAREDV